MAAKLGRRVAMVGKVGTDSFGTSTIENFRAIGVSTDTLLRTSDASTGVAPISVDRDGHNSIVIIPGANNCLTATEVR